MDRKYIDEVWDEIEDMFKAFLNSSQELPGVSSLRRRWRRNKGWLFPFFDEKGRREVKISGVNFTLNKSEVEEAFVAFQSSARTIAQKNTYSNVLGRDSGAMAFSWLTNILTTNFSAEEISSNSICREVLCGIGDDITRYPKGTRITRLLNSFIMSGANNHRSLREYGESKEVREILASYLITSYSQIISVLKPRDCTVVVSINPMDIILSSSHTSGGWKSCHNIFNGEVKTGPLSYVVDGSTAIAYSYTESKDFKSGKVEIINQPEKLWRQMVFFNDQKSGAIMSRQYPSINVRFSEIASKITKDIMKEMNDSADFSVHDEEISGLYRIQGNPWHYTDRPTGVIKISDTRYPVQIKNGAASMPCVVCGKVRGSRDGRSRIICHTCRNKFICTKCNTTSIDGSNSLLGQCYCDKCYEEEVYQCECCKRLSVKSRSCEISTEKGKLIICTSCYSLSYKLCRMCNTHVRKENAVNSNDYGMGYGTVCTHCVEFHRLAERRVASSL